ncbi:MAG: DUF924 family protein [Candidatus Competibacteraceae bacterium]|jgi:uncharacterized protein (DUF924 family)|nr:DUF924 family protein [Candidatus Competibacteraceae bacterium]
MSISTSAEDVLGFWFSERVKPLWFNATPTFDQELAERFLTVYRAAAAGALLDWEETPEGALALVVILDQFPLNLFRNQPESFATEAESRHVAERAIAHGFDNTLRDEQKTFLYMPFMHSEDLADQDRSVALYEQAGSGLGENLKFAHHHREIVRRFGRFPHRNSILGRDSTPEEIAYLNSKEAFLG